jgi:hypothetical protein
MSYLRRDDRELERSSRLGDLPTDFRLRPPELLRPAPHRPSLAPEATLRFPPFETIYGFPRHGAAPGPPALAAIGRLAEHIFRAGRTVNPFSSVRFVGYIAGDEWDSRLGLQRAQAVQAALLSALWRLDPTAASRIRLLVDDCGFSPTAPKVEIYLWVGPGGPAPTPCAARLPSPAEAARTVVPIGPESPEDRIRRILRELPPAPPPRRSFDEMFWRWFDDNLESTMNRAGVPPSLRGPIRDGAHAAVTRGAEAVLDSVLGASGLGSAAQNAIRAAVRAAVKTPMR